MPALSQPNQIEVYLDSPAGEELRVALAYPNTYKVSFEINNGKLSIKANEATWTAPLETSPR